MDICFIILVARDEFVWFMGSLVYELYEELDDSISILTALAFYQSVLFSW